jgi:hypothetical protein
MPLVQLQEWPRAAWDALPPESRAPPPCWVQEELALPGGHATISMGVALEPASGPSDPGTCPAGPYTIFFAYAYLGETVVLVSAGGPYNTWAGVEAVLRALQPRDGGAR